MSQFQDELRKNESRLIEDEKKFREELFKDGPHRAAQLPYPRKAGAKRKEVRADGPDAGGATGLKGNRAQENNPYPIKKKSPTV